MDLNSITKGMSNAAEMINANFVKIGEGLESQKSKNGYQKLPSGLIIQWFVIEKGFTTNSGGGYAANLPIPFPNQSFVVFAQSTAGNYTTTERVIGATFNGINPLREVNIVTNNIGAKVYNQDVSILAIGW